MLVLSRSKTRRQELVRHLSLLSLLTVACRPPFVSALPCSASSDPTHSTLATGNEEIESQLKRDRQNLRNEIKVCLSIVSRVGKGEGSVEGEKDLDKTGPRPSPPLLARLDPFRPTFTSSRDQQELTRDAFDGIQMLLLGAGESGKSVRSSLAPPVASPSAAPLLLPSPLRQEGADPYPPRSVSASSQTILKQMRLIHQGCVLPNHFGLTLQSCCSVPPFVADSSSSGALLSLPPRFFAHSLRETTSALLMAGRTTPKNDYSTRRSSFRTRSNRCGAVSLFSWVGDVGVLRPLPSGRGGRESRCPSDWLTLLLPISSLLSPATYPSFRFHVLDQPIWPDLAECWSTPSKR